MKKILLAFLLSITAVAAQAQIVVPVVWVFALNSSQGTMVREIINEANTIQNKYQFVFEHKAGAGGAIGVNHVANLKQPAILAHTSSFFIRPYMIKEGSYDPDQFLPINHYCADQPIALVSKNYKSLTELQKQPRATIGVLPGSVTELVVAEYKRQNPKMDIVEVGFKGTPDITLSVLGGHIDLGTDFLAGIVTQDVNVLGITGVHNHAQGKTFKSQGVNGLEQITASYYLMVNKNLDTSIAKEFESIMAKAVTARQVQSLCVQDFGQPMNVSGKPAQEMFKQTHQFWRQLVNKTVK